MDDRRTLSGVVALAGLPSGLPTGLPTGLLGARA
jgi:hypothetical protein